MDLYAILTLSGGRNLEKHVLINEMRNKIVDFHLKDLIVCQLQLTDHINRCRKSLFKFFPSLLKLLQY